jgi:hypothetical protein
METPNSSSRSDPQFTGCSEGWQNLVFTGPEGAVLKIEAQGALGDLGMTELFFETVEPANADEPISDILKTLPAGNYTIRGPGIEAGQGTGQTSGAAWLTHSIPAGPVLLTPEEGAIVPTSEGLLVSWGPVTETIDGSEVNIIAYQLIIEKDVDPHPHMIGKIGLSMYLPPSVTRIPIPAEFFEPGASYKWEVLAIEESGNQTLSSGSFSTQ